MVQVLGKCKRINCSPNQKRLYNKNVYCQQRSKGNKILAKAIARESRLVDVDSTECLSDVEEIIKLLTSIVKTSQSNLKKQ